MIDEGKAEISAPAPLRSFGRRKAKPLSARKERLIGELLPLIRVDLAKDAPCPLTALFPVSVKEVWLEIGFGSGEHLSWQAERHHDIGLIGCEPFINGMGTLLGAIDERGIRSIRVHDGDAREVLSWLPDRSIGRIFLLFPDPWPKRRQQKRRLLAAETVSAFARVLKPGGVLRFASDSGDYAAQALVITRQRGAFIWRAERAADWRERPVDWPETRYERKALSEGRKPIYLSFDRV
jgi:tRNA (guanine-N7-)-methyltransferase